MEEVFIVIEMSQGLSFEYVWEVVKYDYFDECSWGYLDEVLFYMSIFYLVEVFESLFLDFGFGK